MTGTVAFTLDLEDHRPDDTAEVRYPAVTRALLDDLDEWGVRGTVFVVGEVADADPALVAEVAARGHEVGLHGARHVPLPDVGPEAFRAETAAAAARLADVAGSAVVGFRAPTFSLVPESAWAPAILSELGFAYSSSVLAAANPLFGWAGAPATPFRWPSGLVELPAPLFGLGPATVPVLGGTYLRLAPMPLVRWAVRRSAVGPDGIDHRWLYAHPYDFDPEEPRWVVPEVGALGSRLLWWNRARMRDRVAELVRGVDRTLADVAEALDDGELPTFDPEAPT